MQLAATLDAILLAHTLNITAMSELIIITSPQKITAGVFSVSITLSIMWARMYGMTRSISVPTVFIVRPNAILPL